MRVTKIAATAVIKAVEVTSVSALIGFSLANAVFRHKHTVKVGNDMYLLCGNLLILHHAVRKCIRI